ncbi:MAG: glycosyltransferase, partial [Candidatus Marinimicrobia bacterium]|nr:glycosyltransferase [Candidatus Neomarinimicrobiota bacterium]
PEGDRYKPSASADTLGERIAGRCRVIQCADMDETLHLLNGYDAVIDIYGKENTLGAGWEEVSTPLWCAVFDARHSCLPNHGFDHADLTFWPSPHYLDLALDWGTRVDIDWLKKGRRLSTAREFDQEALRRNARFTGYVRVDIYKRLSREAVREDIGLDPDRPVVLFIPDSYYFNLVRGYKSALYTYVWCVRAPLRRLFGALFRVRTSEALRHVLDRNFSYHATVAAARKFCDNNGAQLFLASRRRQEWDSRPFIQEEIEAADAIDEGGAHYPQSLLRAILAADLVIAPYRTSSVLEAAGNGKPMITMVLPPSTDMGNEPFFTEQHDSSLRGNWPGVSWRIEADEFNRWHCQTNANRSAQPSVPIKMRQRPPWNLSSKGEEEMSHGYDQERRERHGRRRAGNGGRT